MEELCSIYLSNSFQISIVSLLMLFFSIFISHKYSAKCRYYLWSIIFVAFILPFRAQIAIPIPERFGSILPQNIDTTTQGTTIIANTVQPSQWHSFLLPLWLCGVIVFLGWHLLQHLRFLSAVHRWSEEITDEIILEQFMLVKEELGIQDDATIKSCSCIKTPMLIGLLHPVVLLPQIHLSLDELPLILKHELVHYKRKDLCYKLLLILALSIHWFNPLVHFLVKWTLNLCEISCDEEVLQDRDTKQRMQYGESILGIIRSGHSYHTTLSTNFYSGKNEMKKRINAIMDMEKKHFSPTLFAIVILLTSVAITAFALAPAKASSASSQTGIQNDANQKVTSHSYQVNDRSKDLNSITEHTFTTKDEPNLEPDKDYVIEHTFTTNDKDSNIDQTYNTTKKPTVVPGEGDITY